jgi:alpha-beta hydrolase superfamily lysophospholipase
MKLKSVAGRVALAVVVVGMLAACGNTGGARPAPEGDAFYVPPQPLAEAKPGTIIWSTPIDALPGAQAWKILYHSRAVDGRDIAVSGVVIAPTGPAPSEGRVVLTWAHGTTGLADACAPSKQPNLASQASGGGIGAPQELIPSLQAFLDAGYVVAATDYEGLGTPGLHPYFVGESAGRNVLDAARAARGLEAAAAGPKVLIFGHSQGGHAALFAGELAASYAPELRVLGVATAAPGTDLVQGLSDIGAISDANGVVTMIIEGFHAAYPQFDPAAVLTPYALARASSVDQNPPDALRIGLDNACWDYVANAENSSSPVLAHNPVDIPAMRKLLRENSTGNRPAGAPVLLLRGGADEVISQSWLDAFMQKACAAGDSVDYRAYAGADHNGVLDESANDVVAWFVDRVSGAAATSSCS